MGDSAEKMAHQKKLWDAAQDGDNDKLELAIGCGANINMPDEERFGATALHMAASNGHAKAVKLLADNEANIQELDEDGFQAIHQAAKEGHADALCVLMEAKADPEVPAMRGVRAMHMASRYGHLNVVELLIQEKTQLRSLGDDGEQPIHHAAENRHAGVVATLLEEGADGNAVDENKNTPQELAQANGHKNVVSVLKAFSPAPSQILHILSGIRNMVDDKLDKCEARIGTLEAKAGIEPCDGAPFAPRGGGDNTELTAELASTKEELSTALAKLKSLVPVCPLDDRRSKMSKDLFTKLDADVSGYLDVDEFTVIMRKLDPRIDQAGVINTFKKAGVQQALNIDQFYQWIHVMFGKADDGTFDGVMAMFNDGT